MESAPESWSTNKRNDASQGGPTNLPTDDSAAVYKTAMDKTTENDNASNDCSSYHDSESKGAEPRDDCNEQKPDSIRKRPQDESSPKKYRYRLFWV